MKEKVSAQARVAQLLPTQTGQQIARTLLKEGYTIEESATAFRQYGYVAIARLDVKELRVSDEPMRGMAAITAAMDPQVLPCVVWRKF